MKTKSKKLTESDLRWAIRQIIREEDTEYQKFFRKALDKFGVNSPNEFKSEEEKKKFFNWIDLNWTGEKSDESYNTSGNIQLSENFKKTLQAFVHKEVQTLNEQIIFVGTVKYQITTSGAIGPDGNVLRWDVIETLYNTGIDNGYLPE